MPVQLQERCASISVKGSTHGTPRRPSLNPTTVMQASKGNTKQVTVLDYGAGNVRSLENAVRLLGYDINWVETADDIANAQRLIFPGVGSFGAAMENLKARRFVEPLSEYISKNRPFLGICLGLHTLFEASEESPDVEGLSLFPGVVRKFNVAHLGLSVPSIGWNTVTPRRPSVLLGHSPADGSQPPQLSPFESSDRFYFVHSYRLGPDVLESSPDVALATTNHGEEYLSIFQHRRICATQFHPEKSGAAGLRLIRNFLTADDISAATVPSTHVSFASSGSAASPSQRGLAKRVVACLDVRENDDGDLVVTKGDQYDVRERSSRTVRNLGKPVQLAQRYFREGADEICFLNITSFRGEPVNSSAMLAVLKETSRRVFVPLCIGGGIRDYTDKQGTFYSAVDVADVYFRAGADKVSIGSDAVYAAEAYWSRGGKGDGSSSIERISHIYGAQAVVVSVDPRRVYVNGKDKVPFKTVTLSDGRRCWYQCTVKGGREGRGLDVIGLVTAVEKLGAGEILVNCMDRDGQKDGFELALINLVKEHVSIPVIASSGAGCALHFTECFDETDVEAALAAGIFHRHEVAIEDVKNHMVKHGTRVRLGGRVDEVIGVDVAEDRTVQVKS